MMKQIFERLGLLKSKNSQLNSGMETSGKKHKLWGSQAISLKEETRLKTQVFDTNISPREWMARNGHLIIAGDYRIYNFKDKAFEKWIHEAFGALTEEGLESLWKAFLNEEEISQVREQHNNP